GHHHELPGEPGLRSDRRRHLCGAGGAGARAALPPRSHLRHRSDHFVGRSMSTSAGGSKMADVELRGIAKRYGAVQAVAALGLRMRRAAPADIARRAGEALEMVRLTGLGDRYPRQLSGGQQQRVALARCLLVEPAVLLLDEPLGALDKKLREAMQVELKSLQRQVGITAIFVTHDQEEALTLSDRIAVMHQGRIQQVGAPHEIYETPRTRFVAEFIGVCNFLEGKVIERGMGAVTIRTDGGALVAVGASGQNAPAEG